ncbi:MAG: PAS domain S-box protein [Pseudotabrizicola sp.]|uniref:PAS domain S-box protein n=1 Tax=Pseudotabrizicola sp. TaxID=2939647 RepID=UPI00272451E0|nr:PAS domain S-box protein [Pseudotabrizicola sp.]MDO9639917.1 PAS domain S-box protein [Pseudotabrizicola sp.]
MVSKPLPQRPTTSAPLAAETGSADDEAARPARAGAGTSCAVLCDSEVYRTLLDSIDQAFCVVQIVTGPDGQPCDYLFVEANAAFSHHTGLVDPVGRTALELVPDLERSWIDTYAEVARTGQSIRQEYQAKPLGRYFDVVAARIGDDGSPNVGIFFRDITERRAQEAELEEISTRKAVLLALSDALSGGGEAERTQQTALRVLADHLGVDRVACFEVSEGHFRVVQDCSRSDYRVDGTDQTRLFGRPLPEVFPDAGMVVFDDTSTEPALPPAARAALADGGVRACVGVPRLKGGLLSGGLVIHSSTPRHWSTAELTLIAEAADRILPAIEQSVAETALRESEEKFRQLADLAPSIVWTASPEGTVSHVSKQWHSFFGTGADDAKTGPAALFVHPDDRDRARLAWDKARQSGNPFEMEVRHRRQDGVYRWCLTRARAQHRPDGSVAGWFGTTTDIDDQKRTEDALRKSEARQVFLLSLADVLRASPTALVAQKDACRLLADHLQVDRALLAELDEATGKVHIAQDHFPPALQSVAGSFRAESFGLAMTLLRRGEQFMVRDMHTHEALPVFVRTRFLAGQIAACLCVPVIIGGQVAGAVCVTARTARNWSDAETELLAEVGQRIWAAVAQTRSQTAQREINMRFRTLVEGIPQLVWRAAATGRWTWASPQWTKFTGLTDAESQNAGWLDAVHPDDRPQADLAWSQARDRGLLEVDYRLRDQESGTYRWFQTRALPVRDSAGNLVEWLGTSTDVQDLHDMHERLRTLVAELQHRTRNLMAVVTSITDRTLASSETLEVFGPLIQSRLGSIARTGGLLSKLSDDGQITFDELLDSVFRGHGIDMTATPGLSVGGPSGIRLRSSSVQTLALALHELAAQALAQGGLQQGGGGLTVLWQLRQTSETDRQLTLAWTETFAASAPHRNGDDDPDGRAFGREMIERALPYQFNAETEYNLSAKGLSCRVVLPLGPLRA